jgi:hypothetical protein
MAGRVQEVEGAVAEEVESTERTNLKRRLLKVDFFKLSSSAGVVSNLTTLIGGRTYSKSTSRNGESGFAGYPGQNASLNPGPTTSSVDPGKVVISPMWSKW